MTIKRMLTFRATNKNVILQPTFFFFLIAEMEYFQHFPALIFHPLEKEMITHSSTIAWEIEWTEEPGGLQSMGLWRVSHYWATEHECKDVKKKILYNTLRKKLTLKIYFYLFCLLPVNYKFLKTYFIVLLKGLTVNFG